MYLKSIGNSCYLHLQFHHLGSFTSSTASKISISNKWIQKTLIETVKTRTIKHNTRLDPNWVPASFTAVNKLRRDTIADFWLARWSFYLIFYWINDYDALLLIVSHWSIQSVTAFLIGLILRYTLTEERVFWIFSPLVYQNSLVKWDD